MGSNIAWPWMIADHASWRTREQSLDSPPVAMTRQHSLRRNSAGSAWANSLALSENRNT